MEKKYRLLISVIMAIFMLGLVSAFIPTFSVSKSTVNINEIFELELIGENFYAIELIIPQGIEIVQDDTNGVRVYDIYKTVSGNNFMLQLRAKNQGEYIISGVYAGGNQIIDLNKINIIVLLESDEEKCPTCSAYTSWSNCEKGIITRYLYYCSEETNYKCESQKEFAECGVVEEECDVGWFCEENEIVYQASDCSLSSRETCLNGCSNNSCVSDEDFVELGLNNSNLDILKKNSKVPIGLRIKYFFNKILNFIIFWK